MRTQMWVQQAIGCVIGSAVGDAVGAPFEFGPAGRYSARFPWPVLGGIGKMGGRRCVRVGACGFNSDRGQYAVSHDYSHTTPSLSRS
jgi:hypothetical protein